MSPGLGASWEDELYDTPPSPRPTPSPPTPVPPPVGRTSKLTVTLPTELVERARDVVWHLSGPPEHLTVTGLVERGIRAEIERLELKHHDGDPFPPRAQPVRRGRPLA
jgi:hypothetical protein